MGQVVHEGWLIKSPPNWRFWNTTWHKKYFVLSSGNMPGECCLQYYTDAAKTKFKGSINLQDCDQVDAYLTYESKNAKIKYDWIFDVRFPKKVLYLVADDEESMNTWVHMLCHVCHLQKDDEPANDNATLSTDMEHLSLEPPNSAPPVVNGNGGGSAMCLTIPSNNNNPTIKVNIAIGGGEINMKRAQGYIPLTDCISGPPRPRHHSANPNFAGFGTAGDDAPSDPPPPLPVNEKPASHSTDTVWEANCNRLQVVNHSRAPSNDSSTSSVLQMSSDSDTCQTNNSINNSSSPNIILNSMPPPPRPPKPRRGPVAKEPDLHTPYKNQVGVVEEDLYPNSYDKAPPPRPAYGSLPRQEPKMTPASPSQSPKAPVSQYDRFSSLPRLPKPRVTALDSPKSPLSLTDNQNNLYSQLKSPPVPAADVYQNMKLSPPPRQTGNSPTPLTRPPEVDRSLKPSRPRHRSSTESASSPTSALAPVPVQELQPHIPPRLPDKKKISDTASAMGVIGVTRKESFTRRRNLPSVNQGPSMLATNGLKPLASADVKNVTNSPPTIEYVEMDIPASAPLSVSSAKSPSIGVANGGSACYASTVVAGVGDSTITVPRDPKIGLSYVVISQDKTKALELTKTEQDKMYSKGAGGGTWERSISKASVSSHK